MEDEDLEETYVEVPSEDDYDDYEDDFSFNDAACIVFLAIVVCAIFVFVIKTISKHLKNINFKVGNKIEIGIESKDNSKSDKDVK